MSSARNRQGLDGCGDLQEKAADHQADLSARSKSRLYLSCAMVQALRCTITGRRLTSASLTLPGPGLPMKKSDNSI